MRNSSVNATVHRQAFSELKMPYDTVVAADFADLECEASAIRYWNEVRVNSNMLTLDS